MKIIDKLTEVHDGLIPSNQITTFMYDKEVMLRNIKKHFYSDIVSDLYFEFLDKVTFTLDIYDVEMSSAEDLLDALNRKRESWQEDNDLLDDEDLFGNTEFYDIRINKNSFLYTDLPERLEIGRSDESSLYIDLNPSEHGKYGQVIFQEMFGAEGNIEFIVADSFEELLRNYLTDIESNLYKYDQESGRYVYMSDDASNKGFSSEFERFIPSDFKFKLWGDGNSFIGIK